MSDAFGFRGLGLHTGNRYIEMVQISGTSDQRHNHCSCSQLLFHQTAAPSRPVTGNIVSSGGIGVIADGTQQQRLACGAAEFQQRDFRVNFSFRTYDSGIQLTRIGLDSSVLHPEPPVETAAELQTNSLFKCSCCQVRNRIPNRL